MANDDPKQALPSAEANPPAERRSRRVFATSELSDEMIAAIEKAKVPDEYAYLDEELKDWKPEE